MIHNNNKGFTLVELMITLAMSGIIIAAVYSTYSVQQRAYGRLEQIMEIQQTLRAVIYGMAQDIRMAGYDPNGTSGAGISQATATSITLSLDSNGDGDTNDPGEKVTYAIDKRTLERDGQPLAENIDKLEFFYNKGFPDEGTDMSSKLDDIRSVTISLIGSAKTVDASYADSHSDKKPYQLASQATWYPATTKRHYRRQLLVTTVQCRNMGL